VYFVHSYAAPISEETTSTCDYGGPVAASVESGNVLGVQFHPEKSGAQGLALLGRFAAMAEDR
jgi:glutamine amidotransferase